MLKGDATTRQGYHRFKARFGTNKRKTYVTITPEFYEFAERVIKAKGGSVLNK